MTPATTHPLVAAWLRDLELMLHGVDPGDRAEVLAGVHEHLDATLPPGSTDDDVRRVLADLGSPQSVADEAYAGRPPRLPPPSHPTPRPGPMSRAWVPVLTGLGLGLGLLAVTLTAVASTTYGVTTSSSTDPTTGARIDTSRLVEYGGAFPEGTFFALLLTSWLWCGPILLCLASPLWRRWEKAVGALAPLLAAVAVTALPDLGWAVTGDEHGINFGGWIGLAIAGLGGGYVVLRTWRAGSARADALERGAPA